MNIIYFFRHLFDDFEVFDFSDSPKGAREAFGEHLGGPGGVRGGSGRHLGGSWGSPGGFGGGLGTVLGALGATLERPLRHSDFGSIF